MELSKHLLSGLVEVSDVAENDMSEDVLLTMQRVSLRGCKNILYYITILSRPQNRAGKFITPSWAITAKKYGDITGQPDQPAG